MDHKKPDYAIKAEKINIGFDGVSVLKDVDFSLQSGEVHAVVGSNGAGKSTLMKILNGIYRPTSGALYFFGVPQTLKSAEDARRVGVAMVYQDLSLIPTLTVAQNVFLSHYPRRGVLIDDRRCNRITAELLESVGVASGASPTDVVGTLSSGQQQIVEIIKALSANPRILILDEPTAALSVKEIENFFAVIRGLKRRGISVVYISHYLHDTFKICDSVTVLRDGVVATHCATEDIGMFELVKEMVGDKPTEMHWNKRKPVAPHEKPLLETCGLSTARVKNISLKVHRGEVVGIAGLLGSGRSELFDALFGMDRIKGGEIYLAGKSIQIRTPTEAIKAGISLVPENRRKRGLILDFSVRENAVLSTFARFTRWFLLNIRALAVLVNSYIKSLDIKARSQNQLVRFLSGGNQQKVVVGKCLATESRVLLLDDPTFGVDISAKQEIMSIIRNYVGQNNGAIFVSSEFKEIAEFCDSVYVMKRGEITNHFNTALSEKELLFCVQ